MYSLLSSIPFKLIKNLSISNLLVPYYHMIANEEALHIKNLYPHKNISQFCEDLEFLLKNYVPIGMGEVLDFVKNGQRPHVKSFHLTFDDGFSEMHDIIAPILKQKGIPATFFVSSGFTDNKTLCYQHKASILLEHIRKLSKPGLEADIMLVLAGKGITCNNGVSGIISIPYQHRDAIDEIARMTSIDFEAYLTRRKPYLTSGQIRRLIADGFAIGAHSIDHPWYATLSFEEQKRQTRESLAFIKEKFGLTYGAFAFPHNDSRVPLKFFKELQGEGVLDVSFGTAGMAEDAWPGNIQRVSFEKHLVPAKNIVVYHTIRKAYRTVLGKGKVRRQ